MLLSDQTKVWKAHAHHWPHVGSPLRPIAEDQRLMLQGVSPFLPDASALVAVLGVTPEVVQIDWPASVRLLAVDHNADMIRKIWRPSLSVSSSVKQADWQSLPFADNTLSAAVGDGVLTVLPSLDEYSKVFSELKRTLQPGARLALRCFVSPPLPEPVERITQDAMAGRIESFHALKWRLAMSICKAPNFSVSVRNIYEVFAEVFPDRLTLAAATSWNPQAIDTIDAYRDTQAVYTFPPLNEIRKLADAYFQLEHVRYGSYELAECCPHLVWVR